MASADPAPAGVKTYTGSCHCGFFKYSFAQDLSKAEVAKCNCSICLKLNLLATSVPAESFKLLAPASLDDPGVADYTWKSRSVHFHFCKTCGVTCYYTGDYISPMTNKRVEFTKINLVTIDQDQGVDMTAFAVKYWDGMNNNWAAGARNDPWPGGCK